MSSAHMYQVIPKHLSASTGSTGPSHFQHFVCGCSRPAVAPCGCNLGSGCWERAVGERAGRSFTGASPGNRSCIWVQTWLIVLAHAITCVQPHAMLTFCLTCLPVTTDLLHHYRLIWSSGPLAIHGCSHQICSAPLAYIPWNRAFVCGPLPSCLVDAQFRAHLPLQSSHAAAAPCPMVAKVLAT